MTHRIVEVARTIACCLIMSVSFLQMGQAFANEAIHGLVRPGLVKLYAEGAPRIQPNVGVPDGAKSAGTGFFISGDGYILTTEHFFNPLSKQKAVNIKISGTYAGTGTGSVPIKFISNLPALDLVLLKAIIPFGSPPPKFLEIGNTLDVDRSAPELLTSGYDEGITYRKKRLDFNNDQSVDVPFAWSMNGKTNSGQSGAPVYIAKEGKPLVVGIVKATGSDDTLTYMIPIEFSLPMIGHFKFQEMAEKMDELSGRIESLNKVIGKIEDLDPAFKPFSERVLGIEESVKQIEQRFDWECKDG